MRSCVHGLKVVCDIVMHTFLTAYYCDYTVCGTAHKTLHGCMLSKISSSFWFLCFSDSMSSMCRLIKGTMMSGPFSKWEEV